MGRAGCAEPVLSVGCAVFFDAECAGQRAESGAGRGCQKLCATPGADRAAALSFMERLYIIAVTYALSKPASLESWGIVAKIAADRHGLFPPLFFCAGAGNVWVAAAGASSVPSAARPFGLVALVAVLLQLGVYSLNRYVFLHRVPDDDILGRFAGRAGPLAVQSTGKHRGKYSTQAYAGPRLSPWPRFWCMSRWPCACWLFLDNRKSIRLRTKSGNGSIRRE